MKEQRFHGGSGNLVGNLHGAGQHKQQSIQTYLRKEQGKALSRRHDYTKSTGPCKLSNL